ncbi:MAG: metallophosphoesterase family protein [Planctomycetes bacterium]|jgi:diadenosine tetraphosphatase ApaH/serine/threonine PP2A family protein phosphatase|nr:metallophosphoesterase family protein [Planctomycetota bacterium]
MRVAVISDLHSNREALEAVFAHIQAQSIGTVFCLGDVVGYGPDPEFCVDLVRGHAKLCLMGNHDEGLFRDASDFNPHARGALEYTRARMHPSWYSMSEKRARWRWLEGLVLSHREGRFLFVHGSPRDPVREYVLSTDGFLNPEKLRAVFDSFEGIAVAGHTHHPGMHTEDLAFHSLGGNTTCTMALPETGKAFINVGSVGQPRDGDNRACYAVLEDRQVTWHRVAYDFQLTAQKIMRTGALSEVLARRLALGK